MSWNGLNLGFKKKNWEFGLEQEFRFNDTIGRLNQAFTSLSVEYELLKDWKLGVENRFSINPREQGEEYFNRIALFSSYKYEINRFTIGTRVKYQINNEVLYPEGEKDEMIHKLRTRASLSYNIRKWGFDPKISIEFFRRYEDLNDPDWDKYRFTVGSKYKINKKNAISLAYVMDRSLRKEIYFRYHIIAINYYHKLG